LIKQEGINWDEVLRRLAPNINSLIDQTLLKYDRGIKDYERFVEESERYNFRSLVVPPSMVKYVVDISRTPIATVIGFPHGYTTLSSKVREIEDVANLGAKEVDVVINNIYVKDGRYDLLRNEVRTLVSKAHELGLVIKVIVETSVLNDDELVNVARVVRDEGADFIKTNTGFGARGVTPRDIIVIRSAVGGELKIKASGGIRTALDAALLITLGADIIGTSRGIEIVKQFRRFLKN